MSNKLVTVSFEIDSELKKSADKVFSNIRLDMATAFEIFLRRCAKERKLPLQLSPNAKTIKAIEETEALIDNPTTITYSVDEALDELKKN